MMNGYKTIIGVLIAAVPSIAGLFGYSVASGFEHEATTALDSFIQIVGLGLALYGRLTAQVPGWLAKTTSA